MSATKLPDVKHIKTKSKYDVDKEQTENFNPQNAFYTNSCDFLVNDGKLHVLYANKANDRKFSAPVAGDYTSDSFLMKNTRTTWRPVEGAIDAGFLRDAEAWCRTTGNRFVGKLKVSL